MISMAAFILMPMTMPSSRFTPTAHPPNILRQSKMPQRRHAARTFVYSSQMPWCPLQNYDDSGDDSNDDNDDDETTHDSSGDDNGIGIDNDNNDDDGCEDECHNE